MDTKLCPKTPKCPIFNGVLKGTQFTDTYKQLYCEGGAEGREKCRRFQVAQIAGSCPSDILPNSSKSVEEIIASMEGSSLD